MSDPMAEIRASFFIEAEELLEALQDALQAMSDGDDDSETINVAFRAVHSIKGGAGAFGLDQLVSFAHSFETVMDEVRSGRLTPDEDIIALFFQCGDMLSDLVRVSRDDETLPDEEISGLLAQLAALSGEEADDEGSGSGEDVDDFQPMGISLDLPGLDDLPPLDAGPAADGNDADAGDDPNRMHRVVIRFVPEPELYRSGNEPLYLIRALASLGTAEVVCDTDGLPDLAIYDGRSRGLGWTITLDTDADDAAIREVFEFVEDLCQLEISRRPVPPDHPGPGGGDHAGGDIPADAADAPPAPAGVASDAPGPAAPLAALPDADAAQTEDGPPSDTSAAGPEPDVAAPSGDAPREVEDDAPASGASGAAAASGGGSKPAAKSQPARSGATVRVDLDRIDRLVNLVGELVINQAMLAQSVAATRLSGNTKIAAGLDEFQQLTRDIQDSVMMIRAQPVKSLFQRMARIVREASSAVDKRVRLRTEGENTEIDKTVIARLADPLTHMIRNAVDHGLESRGRRVEAGKSEEGTVTLTASHRSGRVVIEISDDGGGINREKVRKKAIDNGLIPADLDLSDSEIDNLLFLPGFSTADEVSNLSGRGVGMDVVKSAIAALGGRITIHSVPGQGTTFSISLPLTLAVLDGMVVRVDSETLVVPLNAISETLSLNEGDARRLGPRTQVIRVRDSFVPLIDLGTELGYAGPRDCYKGAIVLLINQEDGNRAALVVDGIEDQRQVVIKGLEDSYGHVPGVAAATILGDGQIALILDPADLLANASGLSRPDLMATGTG